MSRIGIDRAPRACRVIADIANFGDRYDEQWHPEKTGVMHLQLGRLMLSALATGCI